MKADKQSIADFYAGKSVFITGGTGFLGKALLEKLLYSCNRIENIFILMRHKKGVCAEERLQQIVNNPIFLRINASRPQDLRKIIPIVGDIALPNLGISSVDEETLIKKVSVVFHVAASIKLHEKLAVAIDANVRGTEYVLNLCHLIKNIKAFVHVSTAYCNTDQKILEEKVYPLRAKLDEVITYAKRSGQDTQYIDRTFLKGLPNTYTFTKGLAENYIAEHCGTIPTIIIRPSIVSPSQSEPVPGWTDNWFGATGLVIASVTGANRIMYGDGNNNLDIMPLDYVSNVTIVAAAKCSSSKSVTVYNCCTSSCNPVSIEKFVKGVKHSAVQTGFDSVYSKKQLIFTRSKWLLHVLTFILHTVPAYLADLLIRIMGKEPKYIQLQSRVLMSRKLLEYYTYHNWEMKADNVKSLHASLSYSDKNIFPCDPSYISWDKYTATFLYGVRRYLMNNEH